MPNKITKRADSNDPRTWTWLPYGWYQECMPPLKWRMQTSGVTQYLQRLNTGLVLPLYTNNLNDAEYRLWDFYPSGPIWDLQINTFPAPGLGGYTVVFTILIQFPAHINPQSSIKELLYPNPYGTLSFDMEDNYQPSTIIPNPVILTPLPYWEPDSLAG